MGIGTALIAREIVARRFEHDLGKIEPIEGGGCRVGFRGRSEVIYLDHRLNEVRRIDLPLGHDLPAGTAHELSRDGRFIAIDAPTELSIADARGCTLHRFPHDPWESYCGSGCLFDRRGRLWCVQPGDKRGVDDRLMVVDPASGQVVAQREIRSEVGHFGFYLSPDDDAVMIECLCGQDGSDLYVARLQGVELAATPVGDSDRTFSGGFSPTGTEFVSGAHGSDSLQVHSFPDGRVLASLRSAAIFADEVLAGDEPDCIGYDALYVDPDHILARTIYGRLLLIARPEMRLLGTVWPDGEKLRGYDGKGRETDDPRAIIDYETGLLDFLSAGPGQVLVQYQADTLRLLDISAHMEGA